MPIDSIGAIASMPALAPAVQPTGPTTAALAGAPLTGAVAGTAEARATDFGTALASQVDGLQALQGERDTLNLQAVTGDLEDIHQATIAAAEASATMDLMVALRNSGLQAFNELMRIQA